MPVALCRIAFHAQHRDRMAGAGGNPGPRPVRRPRVGVYANLGTRAASGLRPGALRSPARSWLTAAGLGRKPNRLRSKARPGAGRKTPRWSAERRAGLRHWPVIPGDPGIGPTARRATGCGVPHPAPVGALPPSHGARGERLDKPRAQKRAARTKDAALKTNYSGYPLVVATALKAWQAKHDHGPEAVRYLVCVLCGFWRVCAH